MSRIGKKPISIPKGVEVSIKQGEVSVKGPKGTLNLKHHPKVSLDYDAAKASLQVNRDSDERDSRALHGLTRALIQNMVNGVVQPFEKRLEIVGVGYQAQVQGKLLKLQVGFAHSVNVPIPDNVSCDALSNTMLSIKSTDKQACGQFAAIVRKVKPPEPYKGKGIKYTTEVVRRKAGKAFGS
jgi:large subunit ribosomal protein L6